MGACVSYDLKKRQSLSAMLPIKSARIHSLLVALCCVWAAGCAQNERCDALRRGISLGNYYSEICDTEQSASECEDSWARLSEAQLASRYRAVTSDLREVSFGLPSVRGRTVGVWIDPSFDSGAAIAEQIRSHLTRLGASTAFAAEPCRAAFCLNVEAGQFPNEPDGVHFNDHLWPIWISARSQAIDDLGDPERIVPVGFARGSILVELQQHATSVSCVFPDLPDDAETVFVSACILGGFQYPCAECLLPSGAQELEEQISAIREGRDPCLN